MNKEILPIIATRGLAVLPDTEVTLEIGREKSIQALEDALANYNGKLIIASQINPDIDDPTFNEISKTATIVEVTSHKKHPTTHDYTLELKGLKAVIIDNSLSDNKDEVPTVCHYQELGWVDKYEADMYGVLRAITVKAIDAKIPYERKYMDLISEIVTEIELEFTDAEYAELVNSLTMAFNYNDHMVVLASLEADNVKTKQDIFLDSLLRRMPDELAESSVDNLINRKLNDNLSKQQKEFYLRERLRVIKEELKIISTKDEEVETIKEKVQKEPYPQHIKQKILAEISKYEQANPNETSLIKSYVDWLVSLPWWQQSVDNSDLTLVSKVLNKNHYGIQKVKERIIEYLAVKLQNPNAKGPIICLVGPPGVGKTSLAKSIAEALNKTYVKVSLGGVKDESEIRGHRRTYLGAMPGRIIKGMKKAGVVNPLFLLDEIDKMSSDFKGDPSSALLEVLDPEQNAHFSDNYIEEEYDLSKVMFVATANYYNQIPEALIDRLEIIELSSYTPNEKLEIAKAYLIPKVLESVNISKKDLSFTDAGINHIINYYTREAGVRELQRMIEKIVRKYLVQKLNNEQLEPKEVIDATKAEHYLGKKRFEITLKDKNSIPGVVNGMAYTQAGGDLLPIETTYFKGKGEIIITGNLEQTMSESASVALGFVKANANKFGIDSDIFKNIDIHIHVPSGGIPKDGPSAGVTLTSSIISALTNTPVSTKISMTGEITLRGKVGIIGGVKEKVISAYRAGVNEIFLPTEDERFLEDIPNEILSKIKIHLVNTYDDIFNEIFKSIKPFKKTTSTANQETNQVS